MSGVFDHLLGLYIIGYCKKHECTPGEAINHSVVLNAAEYYWDIAKEEKNITRVGGAYYDDQKGC